MKKETLKKLQAAIDAANAELEAEGAFQRVFYDYKAVPVETPKKLPEEELLEVAATRNAIIQFCHDCGKKESECTCDEGDHDE